MIFFKFTNRTQLEQLVTFLRTIRDTAATNTTLLGNDIDVNELNAILASLPEKIPGKFCNWWLILTQKLIVRGYKSIYLISQIPKALLA